MDFPTPYTPGFRDVMTLSKAEAGRLMHNFIGAEHFLLAIIRSGKGIAYKMLTDRNTDIDGLKLRLEEELAENPPVVNEPFEPNLKARRVVEAIKDVARELGHTWVGTEHLFLGLLKVDGTAQRCLREFGVEYEAVKAELVTFIKECVEDQRDSRGRK